MATNKSGRAQARGRRGRAATRLLLHTDPGLGPASAELLPSGCLNSARRGRIRCARKSCEAAEKICWAGERRLARIKGRLARGRARLARAADGTRGPIAGAFFTPSPGLSTPSSAQRRPWVAPDHARETPGPITPGLASRHRVQHHPAQQGGTSAGVCSRREPERRPAAGLQEVGGGRWAAAKVLVGPSWPRGRPKGRRPARIKDRLARGQARLARAADGMAGA